MTKPTVGRFVHFYTSEKSRQSNGQGMGPYAAIVTQVMDGDRYINLKVLPPFGEPYDAGSVEVYDATPGVNQFYWWTWPRE